MAADRVKGLIDSGWTPGPGETVQSVYSNMFSRYNNVNRDPFGDLSGYIAGAYETVGLPSNNEQYRLYVLEYGQYQVDVSTEFTHDVVFHMATRQPQHQGGTQINLQGNVNFLQTGGSSNVTQYIGFDAGEAVAALERLRAVVTGSDEPFGNAIDDLIEKAVDESKKPNATWGIVGKALDGVQNLIRTTGAVPATWNLVVGIAAAHGYQLPQLPHSP